MRLALAHKDDLTVLKSLKDDVEIKQGMSVGAAWVVYEIGKQLGIEKALGRDPCREISILAIDSTGN